MSKVEIFTDSNEIRKWLQSDEMRALVRPAAEAIAANARQTADFVDRTGNLRRSIRIESATTDRAVERVVAGNTVAYYAGWVEARTGFLSRAAATAGF